MIPICLIILHLEFLPNSCTLTEPTLNKMGEIRKIIHNYYFYSSISWCGLWPKGEVDQEDLEERVQENHLDDVLLVKLKEELKQLHVEEKMTIKKL